VAFSSVARRSGVIRRLASSVVLAVVGSLAVAPLPAAVAAAACREIDVEATMPDGKPTSVHGLLCEGSSQLKGVIQVFVARATGGGLAYWDFPHPQFLRGGLRYLPTNFYRPASRRGGLKC
jgi:hypothetical protein